MAPSCAGLAEDWNPDDKTVFTKSSFSQGGNFPPVEDNVFLVKGLYSDSLPPFLQQQKAWASGFRQRGTYHPAPLTYLHIDCGEPLQCPPVCLLNSLEAGCCVQWFPSAVSSRSARGACACCVFPAYSQVLSAAGEAQRRVQ